MSFLAPSRLWLLLVVVALAATYVALQRRRRRYAVRFTSLDLLDEVAPARPGWRRHVAAGALAVGITAMVVGLARPVMAQDVARDEAVVVLVVDTSASMQATDVSPTRLAAATKAAADFVSEVPDGFSVGLVAFDGSARLLAAPTTDHDAVLAALDTLTAGPGTATGDALTVALAAVAEQLAALDVPATTPTTAADGATDPAAAPSATIVLLSDGATTTGSSLDDAAAQARQQGVPVTTIAYGTPDGTVTVQGRTVAVPADTASMAQLADETGGSAFTAESAEELQQVYDDIAARVGHTTEHREVDRWFTGVGLIAVVLAAGASLLWTNRFL